MSTKFSEKLSCNFRGQNEENMNVASEISLGTNVCGASIDANIDIWRGVMSHMQMSPRADSTLHVPGSCSIRWCFCKGLLASKVYPIPCFYFPWTALKAATNTLFAAIHSLKFLLPLQKQRRYEGQESSSRSEHSASPQFDGKSQSWQSYSSWYDLCLLRKWRKTSYKPWKLSLKWHSITNREFCAELYRIVRPAGFLLLQLSTAAYPF